MDLCAVFQESDTSVLANLELGLALGKQVENLLVVDFDVGALHLKLDFGD